MHLDMIAPGFLAHGQSPSRKAVGKPLANSTDPNSLALISSGSGLRFPTRGTCSSYCNGGDSICGWTSRCRRTVVLRYRDIAWPQWAARAGLAIRPDRGYVRDVSTTSRNATVRCAPRGGRVLFGRLKRPLKT